MKRGPLVVVGIAVLLTALAGWRLTSLKPESSLDGMLDPHDPSTAAMGRVMRDFPLAEELLVLASLPAGDDDPTKLTDFAKRLAAELEDESTFVAATRWRAGASARGFVQDVMAPAGLLYLSDEQLTAAGARLTPAGMRQQLERNAALLAAPGPAAGGLAKAIAQDPLRLHEFLLDTLKSSGLPASAATGGDAFFTADGRGLLVRIEGRKPPGDLAFSADLVNAVGRVIRRTNTAGLTVDLSGAYAIAAHNAAAIRGDAIESSVVSTVALGGLFAVLYRRPVRTFLLAFVPVVMGLLWGFGLYACFRDTVTPLAAVIGGVLGGVGIDYPVHLMAHRRANESPAGTTRRLFAPLVAAFVTSVVGFVAVVWSPLRVLRDFAFIGSLGLAGAWLATMTVLPALLAIFGESALGAAATRGGPAAKLWPLVAGRGSRAVGILPTEANRGQDARGMAKRPRLLMRVGLAVTAVAIVAAGFAASGLKEDADLSALHPRPNPPLDALEAIDRRMAGGGASFVLLITAADDDSLLDKCWQVRHALNGWHGRLARDSGRQDTGGTPVPQVDGASTGMTMNVFSPASLLPDPDVAAKRIASPRETERVVADFRSAVADSSFDAHAFDGYAGLLPKLLRPTTPPTIADLRRYPDLAQTMLAKTGGAAMAVLSPRPEPTTPADVAAVVAALRTKLAGLDGVTLTGMSVLANDTRTAARRDAARIALTAAIAVTATLMLHLRSVPLALLTVLPTAFSFACVLLAMRAFGFGLNVVNLVMFPLLLGITVDYGIFVTDVLRPGVRDRPPERFLAATTALLTCVATTLIGFGSLVTTAVPAVRSLGWLINIGLAACVVGAIFVLWPAVLVIAKHRGRL